jgi:hypothetical protein
MSSNKALVTLSVAALAAIAPCTAAVNGHFEGSRQERAQRHEIRLKYLDRALDTQRDVEYRRGVLSFLSKTMDDDPHMRDWAKTQLAGADTVLRLRQLLAERDVRLDSVGRVMVETRSGLLLLSRFRRSSSERGAALTALRRDLDANRALMAVEVASRDSLARELAKAQRRFGSEQASPRTLPTNLGRSPLTGDNTVQRISWGSMPARYLEAGDSAYDSLVFKYVPRRPDLSWPPKVRR